VLEPHKRRDAASEFDFQLSLRGLEVANGTCFAVISVSSTVIVMDIHVLFWVWATSPIFLPTVWEILSRCAVENRFDAPACRVSRQRPVLQPSLALSRAGEMLQFGKSIYLQKAIHPRRQPHFGNSAHL
jgi:hypothetical protein